jgi:Flp pilus assembly protein TadD
MKLLSGWLILVVTFFGVLGCAKKEISPLQRKQAATLVSEAEFAATMRDFARAEGLMVQATTLCPDTGMYWVSLGSTRVRLGQRDAARNAYEHALAAFGGAVGRGKSDAEPALQQVYVLALLGRVDDARRLQEKLLTLYPNERDVRSFVEDKRLDHILADPQFKQLAL